MKNKFRHPLVKKIFLSELAAKLLIQLDVSEEEIVDSIHASLQDALLEGLTEFFTTDDQYLYIFQRTGLHDHPTARKPKPKGKLNKS